MISLKYNKRLTAMWRDLRRVVFQYSHTNIHIQVNYTYDKTNETKNRRKKNLAYLPPTCPNSNIPEKPSILAVYLRPLTIDLVLYRDSLY